MIGRTIENFRAPASTGQTLSWDSFAGKVPVVLAFVPSVNDDTDVIEQYNTYHADFAQRRTQILAVAPDTASDLRKAAERLGVTFPVLSDPDQSMFRAFGAVGSDGQLAERVVVVDTTGRVAAVTNQRTSARTVLSTLDDLESADEFDMAVRY